jgi:hypothetical protein
MDDASYDAMMHRRIQLQKAGLATKKAPKVESQKEDDGLVGIRHLLISSSHLCPIYSFLSSLSTK